jgi:hypothetical protein
MSPRARARWEIVLLLGGTAAVVLAGLAMAWWGIHAAP